jgi:peptidyl-prolyl cis-trans isomerase SurA
MIKKLIFIKTIIFILAFSLLKSQILLSANKAFIVLKIDNEIITNLDIKKEYKYLVLLNDDLEKLKKDEIYFYAKNSIVKEKIKKNELKKFFNFDAENEFVDTLVKKFYSDLNLNNEQEISKFLKENTLSKKDIREKIKIETMWNELIYSKYRYQVIIDEDKLRSKIAKNYKKNKQITKKYLLYEILFEIKLGESTKEKHEIIKKSISTNGFKNSAAEYSISESSRYGGKIGWVKDEQLSTIIKNEISKINLGEITDLINVPNGHLILYIADIKEGVRKLDMDKALKEIIKYEKNKQLNQFSLIYYNKIKNNLTINEY